MGLLGSVVLLILGMLSTEAVLTRYRPGLRFWVSLFQPLSGYLGVGAALYGVYLIIRMVAYLGFIRYAPVVFAAGMLSGLVALALGTIYGFDTARELARGHLSERQLALLEGAQRRLLPYKTSLGYAALALSVFSILLNIFV